MTDYSSPLASLLSKITEPISEIRNYFVLIATFLGDMLLCSFGFFLAVYLKEEGFEGVETLFLFKCYGTYLFLCAGIFILSQLYRGLWQYASLHDITSIFIAQIYVCFLYTPLLSFLTTEETFSPFLSLMVLPLSTVFMVGLRLFVRYENLRKELLRFQGTQHAKENVLIIGMSPFVEVFLTHRKTARTPYNILGILDDKRPMKGFFVNEIPVLGGLESLDQLLKKFSGKGTPIETLLLGRDRYTKGMMRDLMTFAKQEGLKIEFIPSLQKGENQSRKNAQEDHPFCTYLPEPTKPQLATPSEIPFQGKKILILGSHHPLLVSLLRRLKSLNPSEISLGGAFHQSDMATQKRFHHTVFQNVEIFNTHLSNRSSIRNLIQSQHPQIIFYLPTILDYRTAQTSGLETLQANLFPLKYAADMAAEIGIEAFIDFSSTKALDPTSPLSLSLQFGERYISELHRTQAKRGSRFITLRHSTLSKDLDLNFDLIESQIEQGGPITLPSSKTMRYILRESECADVSLTLLNKILSQDNSAPLSQASIFSISGRILNRIDSIAHQHMHKQSLHPGVDIDLHYQELDGTQHEQEQILFNAKESLEIAPGIRTDSYTQIPFIKLNDSLNRIINSAEHGDQVSIIEEISMLPFGQAEKAA